MSYSRSLHFILTIIFITLVSFSDAFSQKNDTYNFLRLDVGARPSALAGSFTSVTGDVNSIFYNPAGLATLNNSQATVGFFKYLLDINSGNAAYSQKYKDLGYFGIGIRYINYGTFDKYDEFSNKIGTFSSNDIAISLGYANRYDENLKYGGNLKLIYSNIDTNRSTALAVDLGMIYSIPSAMLDIGASLLNAGTQLSEYIGTREELPLDLRIGISKKLEHTPLTVHLGLNNLTKDEDKLIDRFKNLTVGGEFDFSENVRFRIGYNNALRQDLKTGTSLGLTGFSTGLGVKFEEKYAVDYAFNSLGKIGSTHRINIGFNLK
jgi:hypothetical protein